MGSQPRRAPPRAARSHRVSDVFGGWVLDHHAVAAWARVEPYAQDLVWFAMEVGMAVAVPVVALPLAYAATHESDHDVLRALLDLPMTLHDPLTEANAPELGRILTNAAAAALRALDPDLGIDELP